MYKLNTFDELSIGELAVVVDRASQALAREPWSRHARLTQRELEVVGLIADGLSAKEVAARLCIAPRTVEHHLDHSRLKTRTKNRAHMVAYALNEGLITRCS